MKLAIDIVQSLLLTKLAKDANFDINQTNIAFWETFSIALLDFEKDAKPAYAAIYSLGLNDAEKIISKLASVYSAFIKELAENQVLGKTSKAIDYLIRSKNSTFEKDVQFFTDLEKVIRKVERKRIKKGLPKTLDKLNFGLSDDAIALAIKKKERVALKEKMKLWNEELFTTEDVTVNSVLTKKDPKVISLTWIKFAVAASLVLGIGIWVINNQNQDVIPNNTVVTAPNKKVPSSKTTITTEIPTEAIAEVAIVTKNTPVIESGLGFATKNNNIKIIENNQKARKVSIVKAIENYQKMLEDKFTENKVSYESRVKTIDSIISSLQKELALLEGREKQYIFDGKVLVLHVSTTPKENTIILFDDNYYLKRDADFYKLTVATAPQLYKKISDTNLINNLDDILSENGK